MRVPTRPLARASPFPTAMSLDDTHAAFVELPPCSKSIVVGAIVVGLILNPIFGIDDLVDHHGCVDLNHRPLATQKPMTTGCLMNLASQHLGAELVEGAFVEIRAPN